MKQRVISRVLAIAIFVLVGQALWAAKVNQKLEKKFSDVTVGKTYEVIDADYSKLSASNTDFIDVSPIGSIKLELTHDAMQAIPSFTTATVTIKVEYYILEAGVKVKKTIDSYELSLNSSSSNYSRNAMLVIPGAYQILYTVLSANTDAQNIASQLRVDANLDVDRYYKLSTSTPSISHKFLTATSELNFQWDKVDGAEEYDLEWTFVYAEDGTQTIDKNIFEENSTRVTTEANTYTIPYVYDKGYILYRVRGVSRKKNKVGELVPLNGVWSKTVTSTAVGDFGDKFDGRNYTHKDSLNWQYTVAYAEEGKSKLSMNYADGSLRTRQSVTRSNTDSTIIVGETIYDHQGRAAINALPVPTDNKKVNFYPGFNRSASDNKKAYSRNNFDLDKSSGACSALATAMDSTVSGASYYYSKQHANDLLAKKQTLNENAYIPTAGGYPFSQTEYSPDNTGRVQAKSGVGANMQLNPGLEEHVTRYFYGTPFQKDLDRLFGSEVGYARYYKKNLVVDPNGQVNVSYLDDNDKVIATSLAGLAPGQMDSIPSQQKKQTYVDLLEKTGAVGDKGGSNILDLSLDGRSLTYKKKILVTAANDKPEIYYANSGSKMTDNLKKIVKYKNGTSKTLSDTKCYDCVLDLDVNLTDRCNNQYINDAYADTVIGKEILEKLKTDTASFFKTDHCGSTTPSYLVKKFTAQSEDQLGLRVGEYDLTKVLKVNEIALNDYADDYVRRNKALVPLDFYQDDEITKVDFSGCLDCDDCSKLKSFNTYTTLPDSFKIQLNPNCSVCFSNDTSFYNFKERCASKECNDTTSIVCGAAYDMMLSDMGPNGQYGKMQASGSYVDGKAVESYPDEPLTPENYPLSIYNENNSLPPVRINNALVYPSYRRPYNPNFPGDPYAYYEPNESADESDDDSNVNLVKAYVYVFQEEGKFPEVRDGVTPEVVDADNGIYRVQPQDLTLKAFKENWKPEWAQSLAIYHPEYKYYEFCVKNSNSNDFDEIVRNMDFAEFQQRGFGNYFNSDNFNNLLNRDPFFNETVLGDAKDNVSRRRALMWTQMYHYTVKDNTWCDIWKAAWLTVRVQDTTQCDKSVISAPAIIKIDNQKLWETFREMYLSAKSLVVEKIQTHYAITKEDYCGCIGDKNFSIYKDGFFSYRNIRYVHIKVRGRLCNYFPKFCNWLNRRYVYPIVQKQINNPVQPCYVGRSALFADMSQRFASQHSNLQESAPGANNGVCYSATNYGEEVECNNASDADEMNDKLYTIQKTTTINSQKAEKALMDQCNQCPQAKLLEVFLNDMAEKKFLTRTSFDLSCKMSSFVEALQDSIKTASAKPTGTCAWKLSSTSKKELKATITRAAASSAEKPVTFQLKFKMPDSQSNLYSISDITHICCLAYTQSPTVYTLTKGGNFKITATVTVKSSDTANYNSQFPAKTKEIELEGYSGFNVGECTVSNPCATTTLASNLSNLFNLLMYHDNNDQGTFTAGDSSTVVTVNPSESKFIEQNVPLTTDAIDSLTSEENAMNASVFESAMSESLKQTLDNFIESGKTNTAWYWSASRVGGKIVGYIHSTQGVTSQKSCRFDFALSDAYTPVAIMDITPVDNYPDSCNMRMVCTDKGGNKVTLNVKGYSTCIAFGQCPATDNSESSSTGDESAGYYNCETTQAGQRLETFLETLDFRGNEYKSAVYDFTDQRIPYKVSINLPDNGTVVLQDLSTITFTGLTKDLTKNGNNYFVVHATTNDGVSVKLSGEVYSATGENDFVVGTCYPKYSEFCTADDDAKILQSKLTALALDQKLSADVSSSATKTIVVNDTTIAPCSINLTISGQSPFKVSDIVGFSNIEPLQDPSAAASGSDELGTILGDTYTCEGHEDDCSASHINEQMLLVRNASNSPNDNNVACLKFNITKAKQYSGDILLAMHVSSAAGGNDGRVQNTEFLYSSNDNWDLNKIAWTAATQSSLGLTSIGTINLADSLNKTIYVNITNAVKAQSDSILSIFIRQIPYVSGEELGFSSMETSYAPKIISATSGSSASNANNFTMLAQLSDGSTIRVYGYSTCVVAGACNGCRLGNELIKNGDFEIYTSKDSLGSCMLDNDPNGNKYIVGDYNIGLEHTVRGDVEYPGEIWSQEFKNLDPTKQYVVSFSATAADNYYSLKGGTPFIVCFRDANQPFYYGINLEEQYLSIISSLKNMKTGNIQYADNEGFVVINNAYNKGNGWITYKGIIVPRKSNVRLVFASRSNSDNYLLPMRLDNISLRELDCKEEVSPLCKMPVTSSVVVDLRKACVDNLKNMYQYNAEKRYRAYVDSVRNDFKLRYIAKCLDVDERFDMKYADSEHHFTLYYYDQAGNLVRTVPPAGVVLADTPEDSAMIVKDRLNGTHKFYTEHKMATTYSYNSLNQLKTQSMPDQDDMPVWDVQKTVNQIPSSYVISSVEFVSPEVGILCANETSKGHIYYTSDGGKTWKEVSLSGVNTFNDISYSSSDTAYVTGNGGTMIKVDIAGKTTTVLPMPVLSDFVQVNFSDVHNGVVYDKSGHVWATVDGGKSWYNANSGLSKTIGATRQVKDVEYADATHAYAIADNGKIYKTNDGGANWAMQSGIRTNHLTAVSAYGTYLYAAGSAGNIIKHTSVGTNAWECLPKANLENIKDIHFDAANNGSVLTYSGAVLTTADAGSTWTSGPATIATNFSFADKDSGLVANTNGQVYSSTNTGKTWTEKINLSLADVSAIQMLNKNVFYIANGATNPTLKRVEGTTNSDIDLSALTLSAPISTIHMYEYNTTEQVASPSPSTTPTTQTVLHKMTAFLCGGKLYSKDADDAAWVQSTSQYNDMYFPKSDVGYALKSDGSIDKISFALTSAGSGSTSGTQTRKLVITALAAKPTSGTFKRIVADTTLKNISIVGNDGEIWKTSDAGAIWVDESNLIQIPELYSVKSISNTDAYAVGKYGTIIYTTSGGDLWKIQNSNTQQDLYGISANTAVGKNGVVLSNKTGSWVNVTPSSSNKTMYSVAETNAGWLAVGENKSAVAEKASLAFTGETTDGKLLCTKASNTTNLCSGENGVLKITDGNTWTSLSDFVPQPIHAMHMLNADLGYAVGNNGSVYKMTNSGSVWQAVGTNTVLGSGTLLGVRFVSSNKGFVVGAAGAFVTQNAGQSWSRISDISGKANAVHFLNSTYGFIVSNAGTVYQTINGGASWTPSTLSNTSPLYSVYIADEGCVYTVGAGVGYRLYDGTWYEMAGSGENYLPTGKTYTKVQFVDCKTGYVTSADGKLYKTVNGGVSWVLQKSGIGE